MQRQLDLQQEVVANETEEELTIQQHLKQQTDAREAAEEKLRNAETRLIILELSCAKAEGEVQVLERQLDSFAERIAQAQDGDYGNKKPTPKMIRRCRAAVAARRRPTYWQVMLFGQPIASV